MKKVLMFWIIITITIISLRCTVFHPMQKVPEVEHKFPADENSITFIGHSTALIHISDVNILTDPNFNDWVSIMPRSRMPGMKIEDLPPIDAILISHPHYDHLDKWTLKQFAKHIPILISKGNGEYIKDLGYSNVHELDVWEEVTIKDVKITTTPAAHSGSRIAWGVSDFPKALGFVLQGDKTIYFAGDTGLFDGLKEIGKRFQIDLAMLPVGAFRPRWFMKDHHMGPMDIPRAIKILDAKEMIPIHWGSFIMALDGVDEPKRILKELIRRGELNGNTHILKNGEKFDFDYFHAKNYTLRK